MPKRTIIPISALSCLERQIGAIVAAYFVQPRRVDQHNLRLGESRNTVAAARPRHVPHLASPASLDVYLAHRITDQRVDQRRFSRADLAKDDDVDAATRQFCLHLLELLQVVLQLPLLRVRATPNLVDRSNQRCQCLAIPVVVWASILLGVGLVGNGGHGRGENEVEDWS